ncbi:MAG: HEAT repeat domain-containing protein [Planctomycetota bacterium]
MRLAILACVVFALAGGADTVVLRNGQRVEGKVRVAGDRVAVTTAAQQTLTFRRAEVQEIEYTEEDVPDFKITDELRQRVEEHKRLRKLATRLLRGRAGAEYAGKQLRDSGPEALPFLVQALESDDRDIVSIALRMLGSTDADSSARAIAERLPGLPTELQVLALEQLGRMHCDEPVATIAALLNKPETKPEVKRAGVRALGRLRDNLALPALIRALVEPATEATAVNALIQLDSPTALPYLERLSKRKAMAHRSARVIQKVAGPEHAALLLKLRDGESRPLRRAAQAALRRLKTDAAGRVATYIALLRSGEKGEAAAAELQLRQITGQEASGYRQWSTWWIEQNRGQIRIAVVPIGHVDRALVGLVRRTIAEQTKVRVVGLPPAGLSPWARAPGSDRYRGNLLLDGMERWLDAHPHVIAAVGLTAVPIEMPDQGAALGSFRVARCGLVSLPGLEAKTDKQLKARLTRYTLHVLARALRITTAPDLSCPSGSVYAAGEVDRFAPAFSSETREQIGESVAVSVSILAGDLDGAIARLSKLRPVAGKARTNRELAQLAERKVNLKQAEGFWKRALNAADDPGRKALIQDRLDLIKAISEIK